MPEDAGAAAAKVTPRNLSPETRAGQRRDPNRDDDFCAGRWLPRRALDRHRRRHVHRAAFFSSRPVPVPRLGDRF